MAFKNGVKIYTRFDIACQVLAIAGIIAWQLSGSPVLAVALALSVFLVASLPTWRHAWIAPHAETWEGFVLGGTGSFLTVVSLTQYGFIELAFPTAITLNSILMVSIILGQRQRSAKSVETPAS
jgi:hypothetical protein